MKVLAFDTETRGLDWFDPDQRAFLATWADEHGEYCADLSDEAQVQQFREALDNADVIVGHNLTFDAHHVREALGLDAIDGKVIHDTDLMSRVLYPEGQRKGARGGHGLKNLAKVYLRADAGDEEIDIKKMAKSIKVKLTDTGAYYEVYRAYREVMTRYALQDARLTYDLFTKFEPQVKDLARIYELEMKVMPILLRAEQRGVKTDQVAVAFLKRGYTDELALVNEHLKEELGDAALGGEGSDAALIEALIKVGVPLDEKTMSGKLATNKFALQPFENDYPIIGHLFEQRRLERFLSTYLGPLEGRDVVHTSFRQCGAWTGRMSCTRPNMQNLPKRAGKEVRSVFVPREDHSFVVCDYEGIEVRLLAYYLDDPGFRDLVGSEEHDPHAWMATNIWGGEISDYIKGSAKENTHRLPAKNILFAITYGAGKKRVAAMLRDAGMPSTEDDAKAIISKIKASLPGWWNLQHRIKNKVETLGYVNTMFGRKNPVMKDKSYVGLNALIQGSAADIMKQGLVNVDAAVLPLGGVPLLVVHDEVVVEVPTENADKVLALTEQALIAAADFNPGLAVSGSVVSTSYADA